MPIFDNPFDPAREAALVIGAIDGGLSLANWFDPPEFDL